MAQSKEGVRDDSGLESVLAAAMEILRFAALRWAKDLLSDHSEKHACQSATDEWTQHGHDRVTPVRSPFVRDG